MKHNCNTCQELKDLSEFPKDKKSKTGYSYRCNDCNKRKRKEWYQKNKEKVLENEKNRYSRERERIREYHKQHYQKNKKEINKRNSQWQKNNRNAVNKSTRKWRSSDSVSAKNEKLKNNLRKRIRVALKSNDKTKKTMELLGCDIDFFKKYLESKFQNGMSWDNYGYYGWHIDHIIPCASFNLSDPKEQMRCFHYSNLQPLWWKENLAKGDRIPSSSNKN